MAQGTDLFAPSAGLDATDPVAGTDLFADPNAPGPFKKGVKTSVAGLKTTGAGALALVGDLIGSQRLKTFGLDASQRAQEEAAPTTMLVEDVEDVGGAIDYAKYGAGYLVPQLATSVAAGVLGRFGGALAARGLRDPAAGLLARNAGMTAGLASSAIAQEAGGIYPEAVEAGLPDAAARAVTGGTIAGGLELIPELLAARMLGLFGRRTGNPGRGLTSVMRRAGIGAGVGAAVETGTELAQSAVGRLSADQPLTGPEAESEFLNAAALGAIGGGIVGAPVGALSGRGQAPVAPVTSEDTPEPAPTPEPVPAPEVVAPAPADFGAFDAEDLRIIYSPDTFKIMDSPDAATPRDRVRSEIAGLEARVATLAGEKAGKGRSKEQIAMEREGAETELARLRQRESNLATLEETPTYEYRPPSAQPVLLGEQPAAPTSKRVLTLEDEALLRQAEQGEITAARQGSFKAGAQATAAPAGQAGFETQLALIKRSRGLLLDANEAKALREHDRAAPGVAPEVSRARETVRQITPQMRREAFAEAYERGIENIMGGFAQRGTVKPERAAKVSSALKRAVHEAMSQPDVETASSVLHSRIEEALKGRLTKTDVEVFKQDLAQFISSAVPQEAGVRPLRSVREEVTGLSRQPTLFSKAAANEVEFLHWGDVPNLTTDPARIGTGKRGEDQQIAATVGLQYTSAVVKGTNFQESGVTERQPYVGRLRADRVYTARADDPLYAAAVEKTRGAPGNRQALAGMQYAKDVRDLGFDAILYPEGQLRIFTPQAVQPYFGEFLTAAGLPTIPEGVVNSRAKEIMVRHRETGGSTTFLRSGKDGGGMNAYAVSIYKDREVKVGGPLNAPTLAAYIRANDDLLGDETNALGTWFNPDDGITYLDISKTVPDMRSALRLARENDQLAFFDLRTLTNIPLGHPLFDVAQEYNAAAGLPPIQEVEYIEFNPETGKSIARAYEQLQAFNDSPRVREAFDALAAEEQAQFDMVSRVIKIEPWTKEGQAYANSAEMRADVFGNNHLWVFQGGEGHPLRTPEQTFRGRAVHDLFAHARTGFEFGARGELNATRIHAQMYSERALPALIVDNIGQNAWVNFSDANEGLPAAQRAFAEQKVDLLPEAVWRGLLGDVASSRAAAWARRDAVLGEKGQDVLSYLESILGTPKDLLVRQVDQIAGGVGGIRLGQARAVIELSMNAKDIMSVAAHEGYHYLEDRVLPRPDRDLVRRAFEPGAPMFETLMERVREYDRTNSTNLAEEVRSVPAEARAYAFEFWRRGELKAQGAIERIFKALARVVERIRNYIDGRGFSSFEDVFEAIERGDYAQRELQGMLSETMDMAYIEAIEPDAIPNANVLFRNRKAASQAKGRPAWIKGPAELKRLRMLLGGLTREGDGAKDWYRRSAQAVLRWAGNDQLRAGKMAALVAMYSPRTPVGQDLRRAMQHFAQWEAGQPINAGGTRQQAEYGSKILDGTGHRDHHDRYVLPGNLKTAPKTTSFFKNMMLTIDPVRYPPESQDATIDMWMSHIFGFSSKDGKISDANYWWADAEIKKLASEVGMAPDQVQAAVWVAIKARGNMTRALARRDGIERGWFKQERTATDEKDLFGSVPGRVKFTLKPKQEFNYMVNWIKHALSVPFSQPNFEAANYSYAEAFHDIVDGTVPLNRLDMDLELDAGLFDDIAFGKPSQGDLTFYSRAASLADMAQRVREGELPRTQMNAVWAEAVDRSDTPVGLRDSIIGTSTAEARGLWGGFKRLYSEHLSSGLNLSRNSEGYRNVFGALTSYTQRKSRLIAEAVERQLSEWVGPHAGSQDDKHVVSRALLQRTENAWAVTSPEVASLRAGLTEKQRSMFDQATRMIAAQLDAELRADAASYRKLFANDDQYAGWYRDRAAQVERLKEEGYFPERRYGDHVVHAYVPGPDGKKITVYYSQHQREADARTELGDLKQALGPDAGLTFEYGYRYRADYDASLSFAQFLDIASRHGVSLTQAEKERIGKALISADSVRRNRVFRRKNIAGYSEDGMRVLAEFGVTTSNKVAYAELGEAINDAINGKEVQIRFDPQGRVEINTYDRDMWALDGEKAGFYRNLADNTVAFTMNPRDTNPLSRGLRAAASAHFLGGSAAAMMVNSTALPMNTVPWLTQHTSYTDAFAKVLGGAKLAVQHLKTIRDLPKLLDPSVAMEGIDNVVGLRRALQIATQDGTVLDTEIYQIMGLSRGQEYSLSGRVQQAVSAWMLPFRLSEQFNRVATFIAAYKIAKEKNMANDAAYKLAQDTVYATQFRYDEANRPALARGNIGSLLFVFKTYPIFATELMIYLAREKPQAAVYMMLSYTMMSGLEGLPFAEDIEDLIDTIAQRVFGSPFNSKRALRNVLKNASEAITGADLSSVLMHGMANELTGMSFASRVGLGNLLPGTRFGTADADYGRVLGDIMGPVGSMVTGALGGLDALNRGNFEEAARRALPLAGQNAVKSWQQWEKGFAVTAGGDRRLVDVGGMEAFWQAFGFTSASLMGAYETDMIDRQTLAFYQKVKTDITRDLVQAVRENKPERVAEIAASVGAWNTAHPEMPLALSPSNIKQQIALAGMTLNERTFKLLPRTLRGSSETAIGLEVQ